MTGIFLLSATQSDAPIFHKKKKVNKSTSAENTAEPDKILYDKAMDDIKHRAAGSRPLNCRRSSTRIRTATILPKPNWP